MLDQNVFGKPTSVTGAPNLTALEIDTKETIEKSKKEIREKIEWFLKFAEVKTKADEFVESATMNPAFEESAMFENMIDLMFKDEYEVYVFDTAPTANARRLLGMSSVYSMWVNKMVESRKEAMTLRELLSYSRKKQEKDPLMDYLLELGRRMGHAKTLLTDAQLTSFFFITLPEALPIAVIARFIDWFREFGIPVGGVIVNMKIDPSAVTASSPDFVKNRVAMQEEHMQTIWKEFDGQVRAILPLLETEVRGVPMLDRMAGLLYT
jgi:arsenite-transporting ATPase